MKEIKINLRLSVIRPVGVEICVQLKCFLKKNPVDMCLAIPGRLISVEGEKGVVDFRGVKREVVLTLIPDVKVGDFVIVHAGFGIQILDETEAKETLDLLDELVQ